MVCGSPHDKAGLWRLKERRPKDRDPASASVWGWQRLWMFHNLGQGSLLSDEM